MRSSRQRVSVSSARHSTASAPWPTCGGTTAGSSRSAMRYSMPSRSSASAAMTTAATASRSAYASRVAMLPRRPWNVRSGRACASCARRRSDPLATVAPDGRAASVAPTRASRTSARSGTAPITRPSGVSDGRALAECTATSARPSSTAACTSLTKTPLPPSSQIGTSRRRSPLVSTTTVSTSSPGSAFCARTATWSACQRASAEPRVATRSLIVALARARIGTPSRLTVVSVAGRPSCAAGACSANSTLFGAHLRAYPLGLSTLYLEQLTQRGHEAVAPGASGGVLEHHRRLVEQLGHQALGHRVHQVHLVGAEAVEPPPEPVELGLAHHLGALAQRHDHRRHLAGRAGVEI